MIDMFARYLRERFKLRVFGVAAVVHAAAALWAAGTSPTLRSTCIVLGLTLALLLQFRLWDDLEDRERDRISHPNRLLVRSDPSPFRFFGRVLAVANLLLVAATGSLTATGALLGLDLFFWLAYGQLRSRLSDRSWRFQILLLKYPVFVDLVAATLGPVPTWRLLVASGVIYVCACAYESLHDRQLPLGAIS
jgi:4-hydroxybenzoate polyprenyltransferase